MLSLNRFRHARRGAESVEPRTLRERGAAALEFALIAPLFFLIVFGGIEVGYMFRSNLALEDLTRTSARIASVQRSAPDADQQIIEHINEQASLLNGDITWITIFAPESLSDGVPNNCTEKSHDAPGTEPNSSVALACNVYKVTDGNVQAVVAGLPGATQNGVPPAARTEWTNIGVYIEYEYQYVTGFFNTLTLSSTSVEVVELDVR